LKRLLLDVNVILDVLFERPGHAMAGALWKASEEKQLDALLPAHGVTTVFYLASKERDASFARAAVGDLLTVFGVAEVTGAVLRRALTLGWPDFEDAVCAAAAEAARCDAIVTRDPSGFPRSPVEVFDPPMAVAWLVELEGPEGSGQ